MVRPLDIVVAHYNEDLSWLEDHADDVLVYTKASISHPYRFRDVVELPNIGREGHTYLHHIITHYDDLADQTLFVQGQIDDHVSDTLSDMISNCSKNDKSVTYFTAKRLDTFQNWDGLPWNSGPLKWQEIWSKGDLLPAALSPAEYFARYISGGWVPSHVHYSYGAIFSVPKSLIRRHSREFYEDLMQALFLGPIEYYNPETGHILERFWLSIFEPEKYCCQQGQCSFRQREFLAR